MYGVNESNFNFFQMAIHLLHCHLQNCPSFSKSESLPLSHSKCQGSWDISEFSILFHWSIGLPVSQSHTALSIETSLCSLIIVITSHILFFEGFAECSGLTTTSVINLTSFNKIILIA